MYHMGDAPYVCTLTDTPKARIIVSFKIWAYKRAGWTADELDQDILTIYKKRGLSALKALPNIGLSIAAFIAERLDKS
jgi:DNA polymerase/3'-5' exonuclease PolX